MKTEVVDYFKVVGLIFDRLSGKYFKPESWSLGEYYLCHPDLVIKQIKKYSGRDREYLWNFLTFGFENVTWQKENEIENYKKLKNKLND